MDQTPKIEEFKIPEKIAVFEDKKTKVKTCALPFQFPDGKNGVVMISRLWGMPWKPDQSIDKIVVYFK